MAAEVTYKVRADVDNEILVKLTDFLKLPEVIEAKIILKDAQKFITPAPLHMVANVNSKSSPVRMVIVPSKDNPKVQVIIINSFSRSQLLLQEIYN